MPTTEPHVTGEVLRALRVAAGVSRRALARMVPPDGISHQHLALIESGERILTPDLAQRVAQAIADHYNSDAA